MISLYCFVSKNIAACRNQVLGMFRTKCLAFSYAEYEVHRDECDTWCTGHGTARCCAGRELLERACTPLLLLRYYDDCLDRRAGGHHILIPSPLSSPLFIPTQDIGGKFSFMRKDRTPRHPRMPLLPGLSFTGFIQLFDHVSALS